MQQYNNMCERLPETMLDIIAEGGWAVLGIKCVNGIPYIIIIIPVQYNNNNNNICTYIL